MSLQSTVKWVLVVDYFAALVGLAVRQIPVACRTNNLVSNEYLMLLMYLPADVFQRPQPQYGNLAREVLGFLA